MALQRRPALYEQLAAELRSAIDAGDYPPGELLPSETALAARYEVSRPTVRQAMAQLRVEGLIISRMGKGSFVRGHAAPTEAHEIPRRVEIDPTNGHHTSVDTRGLTPIEPPAQYQVNADADLAALVSVDEGHPAFVRDRLLADEAGHRQQHRLYVPFTTCAGTALEDDPWRDPDEIYDLLAAGRGPLHWREHTTAQMPNPDQTASLKLSDATPVLTITRVTLDEADVPLIAEQVTVSAQDTRLVHDLMPTQASASAEQPKPTTARGRKAVPARQS